MLYSFWRRVLILLFVLLLAGIGAGRIISTYGVFNHITDEPAHIACGMEWLTKELYTYEEQHPPFARVAAALGPFLAGIRYTGQKSMWREGKDILHTHGLYYRNLALARMGILPFFLLATIMVWIWSRKLFGDATALVATALFTSLPPVLAHAGLATTDMAIAATFLVAIYSFTLWLERPTVVHSLMFGIASALAILSKFSALLFLPVCCVALLTWRWVIEKDAKEFGAQYSIRRRFVASGLCIITAFFVIWAGYHFSVSSLTTVEDRPHEVIDRFVREEGALHDLAYTIAEAQIFPASELFKGVEQARLHNARGHTSYLFGKVRQKGWWYYFPVALAVKTPIPFLILTVLGIVMIARQVWHKKNWRPLEPAICAVAILLACLLSNINIGVRHILPIYPLLAIIAGFGAISFWNLEHMKSLGRGLVIALMVWQVTTSILSHPDYLAYFNELAGRNPEQILIDTDLDWGQDLQRLSNKLSALGVSDVAIKYFGTADLDRFGLPAMRPLVPYQSTTGWIAISIWHLKISDGFSWLEAYEPAALVGRSIRLYYIPETKDVEIPEDKVLRGG